MRENYSVVSLSGGADSATLLYFAMTESSTLHAVSVDYGQRHRKELDCAKALCIAQNVPHTVIKFDLTVFGGSPLTDPSLKVPTQAEQNQSATVVPFRNTFLATICAAYCKQHGLNTIYMGPTYEDLANYEDCRPEFFEALEKALIVGGTVDDLKIRTPFINKKKVEIIQLGHYVLEVPYEKTWTCYVGADEPCLECDACQERIESFVLNGLRDPLVKDDATWQKFEIQFEGIKL